MGYQMRSRHRIRVRRSWVKFLVLELGVRLKIQIQEAKLQWGPLLKLLDRAEVKGVKPWYGVRDPWLVTRFGNFWV